MKAIKNYAGTEFKGTKEVHYFNAKHITVFASTGYGRRAKSDPMTYRNVLVSIQGTSVTIYTVYPSVCLKRVVVDETYKKSSSKYFQMEAREITKATFNRNINTKKKEAQITLNTELNKIELEAKQKEEKINNALNTIKQRANEQRLAILLLQDKMKKAKKQGSQAEWHKVANQMVQFLDNGNEVISLLGWKTIYSIGKGLN